MPTRAFFIPLDQDDPAGQAGERTRVRFTVTTGIVVAFTVQYETPRSDAEDEHSPVVRYDTAHGRPHRDLLDARGETIEGSKLWLPAHLSFNAALTYAIDEITRNWQSYRDDFFRRTT